MDPRGGGSVVAATDAWGPGLPMPAAPTPASGGASSKGAESNSAKPHVPILGPDVRYTTPFSEDAVYQAALQQAMAACQLLPTPLAPQQFSNRPAAPIGPPPSLSSIPTAAATRQLSTATASSTSVATGAHMPAMARAAANGPAHALPPLRPGSRSTSNVDPGTTHLPPPLPLPPPPPATKQASLPPPSPPPAAAGLSGAASRAPVAIPIKQQPAGLSGAVSRAPVAIPIKQQPAGLSGAVSRAPMAIPIKQQPAGLSGAVSRAPVAIPIKQQQQQPGGGAGSLGSAGSFGSPTAASGPGTSPGVRAGSRQGPTAKGSLQVGKRFEDYYEQSELQRRVKSGGAFTGTFRVNASNRSEAYVTVDGLPHDVLIRGDAAQNRALEGDEVAVEVLPMALWFRVHRQIPQELNDRLQVAKDFLERGGANSRGKSSVKVEDGFILTPWVDAGSPTAAVKALSEALQVAPVGALRISARVVAVMQPGARREHLVGVLQAGIVTGPGGEKPLWLLPLDPCMPRCLVLPSSAAHVAPELKQEAATPLEGSDTHRTLVSARITSWSSNMEHPHVEVRFSLGQAGEIESETAAILEVHAVRDDDFSPQVLACLPPTPWNMSPQDMAGRRDFRSLRVLSIDPATARDLDDALHVTPVPGRPGHWHVGVHIADVAHFIAPYSSLDYEAGLRSTSVYLVQRVVPMLPRLLCEELCSLNPGVDRFSFSIEWELDEEGEVVAEWAGRSIIRSRAKLAYPMVQDMIEGVFKPDKCEAVLHDGTTWDEVVGDCLALNQLAQRRRQRRFNELGALRLDNVRLYFTRDTDGNPVSAAPYQGAAANHLVEEFMLLANMRVARLISTYLPERAMLRFHPPPKPHKILELQALADQQGLALNCSSAGALQASLTALRQDPNMDPQTLELITQMTTKPMQLALYFCTGETPDVEQWRHYALAVPEYTHFTSPIRRYPDVVVHRQLAAVLEAHPELSFADPSYYAPAQQGALIAAPSSASSASLPGGATGVAPQPLSMEQVVSKHKLFKTDLTGKVAQHCNKMRLAARNAQEASLRLFLCVLLRRQPVVAWGLVCNLGGDKHLGVYVPSCGLELRLFVEDHMPYLAASFNPQARCLSLSLKPAVDVAGAAGRQGSLSRTQSGGAAGQGNGGDRGGEPSSGPPDLLTWLSPLPHLRLAEPGLQPSMLPLHVKLFDRVPLVLTSLLRLGQISQVEARLLLHPQQLLDLCQAAGGAVAARDEPRIRTYAEKVQAVMAAGVGPEPAAMPPPVVAEPEPATKPPGFMIPYETMLND